MTIVKANSQADKPAPLEALSRLLAEGTAALAELDTGALARLQGEALQVRQGLAASGAELGGEQAGRDHFESCRRIFAEVLRSTGEHLDLLKRMSAHGREEPWAR